MRASIARTAAWRNAWSACVPWLKFRRNTSAPARASASIAVSVELDGPSVATIFVERRRSRAVWLSFRISGSWA
ncbi:Uncharacterised protein [Burkholderia pseudomallei]|nr:Uncharacterised protein [Burkholderia pseudomallei]CAJ9101608.1 Uncharacterised protein [Burkholderia pseudomallei]